MNSQKIFIFSSQKEKLKKLEQIRKLLKKHNFQNIELDLFKNSIILSGKVSSLDEKMKAGYLAANKGFKGVVNEIEIIGFEKDKISLPVIKDSCLENKEFDITIIGGGVIGCAIARELSRYDLKIALIEKENDVAKHQSSHNDGMIHPGFAPHPGSKKAYYNVIGNKMYSQLTKELNVDFKRVGELILLGSKILSFFKPLFYKRARQNKLSNFKYLQKEDILKMEPYLKDIFYGGFFIPDAGILNPFELTIALAENAIQNGVSIFLNTACLGFEKHFNTITKVKTNRGSFNTKVVINAAGLYSDYIASLADDKFFSIHPRKGVDAILDIKTKEYQKHVAAKITLKSLNSKTKGGGIVPTIEGNLLIGPTAKETIYKEDYSTDSSHIEELLEKMAINKKLNKSQIITYFAGNRACTYEEDFIIEKSDNIQNLIHAAGIQSPGLASAPAIAKEISSIAITLIEKLYKTNNIVTKTKSNNNLKNNFVVKKNKYFNPIRKKTPRLNTLSLEQRAELIRKNPSYGKIICRCEGISEGEIIDALNSPLEITTLDQIKRRTRAQTGRCQGGFCTPRIMELIAKYKNIKMTEITKKGDNSYILACETKKDIIYSGLNSTELNSNEKKIQKT